MVNTFSPSLNHLSSSVQHRHYSFFVTKDLIRIFRFDRYNEINFTDEINVYQAVVKNGFNEQNNRRFYARSSYGIKDEPQIGYGEAIAYVTVWRGWLSRHFQRSVLAKRPFTKPRQNVFERRRTDRRCKAVVNRRTTRCSPTNTWYYN